MGCGDEEDFCRDFDLEGPLDMRLTWGLLVATHEESEARWQDVMGARTVFPDALPDLPAVYFTFDELAEYLNARSVENGLQECYELIIGEVDYNEEWPRRHACTGWRLPTRVEREYFARAGTKGSTWLGEPTVLEREELDPMLDQIAYYFPHVFMLQDSPIFSRCPRGYGDISNHLEQTYCRPTSIGTRSANPWGLHDILGNVSELTWDRWGRGFRETVDAVLVDRDPETTGSPTYERLRHAEGGNYDSFWNGLHPFTFTYFYDEKPHLQVGFRPVRSLPGVRFGRTIEPR
jgi:formylglycine-generating enzyme required for sulfatase activity